MRWGTLSARRGPKPLTDNKPMSRKNYSPETGKEIAELNPRSRKTRAPTSRHAGMSCGELGARATPSVRCWRSARLRRRRNGAQLHRFVDANNNCACAHQHRLRQSFAWTAKRRSQGITGDNSRGMGYRQNAMGAVHRTPTSMLSCAFVLPDIRGWSMAYRPDACKSLMLSMHMTSATIA